jgi:hypothetical protein
MFTHLLATVTVATAFTVAVTPPASAEWDKVRYCETVTVGGVSHTWIETDRVEFDMPVMTMRNTPIRGERYLIESPVKRGPVVMDCRVRVLNGKRTAIITTRGGAEWAVVNPHTVY